MNNCAECSGAVEEWRLIASALNYMISNYGRVKRILPSRSGNRFTGSGTCGVDYILKPRPNKSGYWRYELSKKNHFANRTVLFVFVGMPSAPTLQAAHNDGDKTHNHLGNLRWATPLENSADRNIHGTAPIGPKNPKARLTESLVLEIIELYAKGATALEISKKFSIRRKYVSQLITSGIWGHIESPFIEQAKQQASLRRLRV